MTGTGPLEADVAVELERLLRAEVDDWYHPHDSRRSRVGWPDYAIVLGPWLLFAELKREAGCPTPEQAAWLLRLVGPGRIALLVGGLAGVEELGRLIAGMKKGRLRAAPARVVVLGKVSPKALALVGAIAADATTPTRRPTPGIRRRRRGW